jgi:hypothetical protein
MKVTPNTTCCLAVLLVTCGCVAERSTDDTAPGSAVVAAVTRPLVTDAKDQAILKKFVEHAHNEARALTKEAALKQKTPEMFCWLDLRKLGLSLTAYEFTGNADHLVDFVWGFENLRSVMAKDSEGYWGWRGLAIEPNRNPDKPNVVIDDIQTTFRAIGVMARFIEIIDRDPALKATYAAERKTYLDLMENHLYKKWESRGSYVDLGAGGGIYRNNPAYTPRRADITLPYEKTSIMVEGLLNLYRATGNDVYFRRAIKLGTRLKRRLTLAEGRYGWHYWDPTGRWDVSKTDPEKWGHWIGIEPNPGWHSVTVGIAVQLYHHGVVFNRTDIQRFLRTQMEVCWNGSTEDPRYFYTNGKAAKKNARMIAQSLAPFDEKLATFLYTGKLQDERVANSENAWNGGVVAETWLRTKFLVLPKATGGKQIHLDYRKAFLKSEANRKFLGAIEFNVTGLGHQPPLLPSKMTPMPEAPPTAVR